MVAVFPELADTAIDYAWGGKVAFTRDEMPHAGLLDGMYYAGGYCGHGIAMATYLGELTARRIAGELMEHPFSDDHFPPIPFYSGNAVVPAPGRGLLQGEGLDSMSQPAPTSSHRAQLRAIAVAAMRAHGLDPDFPADALAEVAALNAAPASSDGSAARDLRGLLWCSIDNDDSRDLDQLSVAEPAATAP